MENHFVKKGSKRRKRTLKKCVSACVCMCICVCMCVRERVGERERRDLYYEKCIYGEIENSLFHLISVFPNCTKQTLQLFGIANTHTHTLTLRHTHARTHTLVSFFQFSLLHISSCRYEGDPFIRWLLSR